ncbi:hypothetical protein D9M69_618660 [compost metagenome]
MQPVEIGGVPADAQAGDAVLDAAHHLLADALFHVHADVPMGGGLQERRDVFGKRFGEHGSSGQDAHLAFHAAGVRGHIALDASGGGQHGARVLEQRFSGRGRLDAAALARQQLGAHGVFQLRQPLADGRADDVGALACAGDVAGLAHGDEQAQSRDIQVAHGCKPVFLIFQYGILGVP